MGYLLSKYALAIWLIAFLLQGKAVGGNLGLNVVYPEAEQSLPPVDSSFIFGSVDPEARLYINGIEIEVHKDGGWLAFLPVQPGRFEFFIKAEKDGIVDTLTLTVQLPELPEYGYDSLYFFPGTFKPSDSIWVKPGDRIDLGFSATPYCNAFCVIANTGDTVWMKEMPPRSYHLRGNVFGNRSNVNGSNKDTLFIKGEYRGSLKVPDIDDDSLILVYHIYPPSFMQMAWMIRYRSELRTKPLPLHELGSLSPLKSDTVKTTISILKRNQPLVAELTDSLTVIRTGPGKGYLCIHQPAGIRAEVAGKSGKWLKLKLSKYQHGWIPDTAALILPEGVVPPHSYVRSIRTESHDDYVTIDIVTSARHPFRIVENARQKSITVYLYGVDSDTDWIRYDSEDSLIDYMIWFQSEPGVYGLEVFLTADRIWGYDGYYKGDKFRFDIKKFPESKNLIENLRFVIDPGHSPDPGAVGPTGLTEKEVNLAIAGQLARDLRRLGAEVVLTRRDDSPLPLYDRPAIAYREKADIFISIHNNALPNGVNPFVNNGVSTFYYHPHSAPLARSVQESLSRELGLNDFGWYYANFAVNRPTQYPAILVECAFMMIPEQEALLRTDKFKKRVSFAIIEGVRDFLRGRPETEWDRRQAESYEWR